MVKVINEKKKAFNIFKKRPKFTNCYMNFEQFSKLIEKEKIFLIEDNLFILKKENNIFKFLYFVDDLRNIKMADEYLNNFPTPIALEFLSKAEVNSFLFQESNFKLYKIFSRYSLFNENRKPIRKIGKVELANSLDALEIRNIAVAVFDPLCDFIPTVMEIEEFINNKEVFVVKNKQYLLAFAIYIKKPYGYDFRLNCVNPKYESGLVGYSLVSYLPEDGNKYICWINDLNTSTIRLNTNIGFKKDGLKNYIFVRN